MDKNIFEKVRANINELVDKNVKWSIYVTHEEIENFMNGSFPSRFFFPPKEWLPVNLDGVKILCLAGAGGQQAPLLAAAGAKVTVFDLSEKMLEQDKIVAQRENLEIIIEQGNMCDLSRFSDNYFDIIINAPSLFYIPDTKPVFKECYRVLKNNGIFIMNAPNPVNYILEYDSENGVYVACNKLPYKSFEHENQGDWIEYGHTLETYIGGQIQCGFAIIGFYENRKNEDEFETEFMTRAIKHNFH
ncbi:MAG: class I SAM-dependent methyltransferase [Clostridiales bacterium]|jgi:2-polyprenyl-3-methyl-5-hydroxy-6-metoxy-1,4-benzoquinol methylase|nr:class I SAM-dependent methyltransferase [Clostridiales bacterium]